MGCPRVSVLLDMRERGRYLGVMIIVNQLEIVHHVSWNLEVVVDVDDGLFLGFLTPAYDVGREDHNASQCYQNTIEHLCRPAQKWSWTRMIGHHPVTVCDSEFSVSIAIHDGNIFLATRLPTPSIMSVSIPAEGSCQTMQGSLIAVARGVAAHVAVDRALRDG